MTAFAAVGGAAAAAAAPKVSLLCQTRKGSPFSSLSQGGPGNKDKIEEMLMLDHIMEEQRIHSSFGGNLVEPF